MVVLLRIEFVFSLIVTVACLRPPTRIASTPPATATLGKVGRIGRIGGEQFNDNGINDEFKTMAQQWQIGVNGVNAPPALPSIVFGHLGDEFGDDALVDDYAQRKQRHNFNVNVGKALELIRKELPLLFAVTNLDFSIFAPSITLIDEKGFSMKIPVHFYKTVVTSLRMAATFSSMYPSMNVRKIEYVEDCRTIQCLVDVVLPDSVRIDGQAVWQGMFYFGLNSEGLIETHAFDRKISNLRPQNKPSVSHGNMPWLRVTAGTWSADLLSGGVVSRPDGGLVVAWEDLDVSSRGENNREWNERLKEVRTTESGMSD